MFRDLLDEDGHILTHNFRPIQPLGDRIVLFNIKDNDDNALDRTDSPKDEIPPEVNTKAIDDNMSVNDKNVMSDAPDNKLEDEKVANKLGQKSRLESGSMTNYLSVYLLAVTIVTFILSGKRMC